MAHSVELPVPVPGLRAVRWTTDQLFEGVKDYYALGRVEQGRSEYWSGGKVLRSEPGCIQVKQPGDVHRDISREGPTTWVVITLPANDVAQARSDGKVIASPQLAPDDPLARPFHRLHDAVCAGADRLAVEVALAEAINGLAVIRTAHPDYTRPVRRAIELLRARIADPITLDDLADHAGLDKFHLCRAFRAQVGMPPHAYLTRLRILRAKELLSGGSRASEIAPLVGFYDQSQLTRHFRRIVGMTPARYGKMQPSLPKL